MKKILVILMLTMTFIATGCACSAAETTPPASQTTPVPPVMTSTPIPVPSPTIMQELIPSSAPSTSPIPSEVGDVPEAQASGIASPTLNVVP